jgi:hypothetical protein
MSEPIFIVGAGFNADASAEVEPWGRVKYPLLSDLDSCFVAANGPKGESVEQRFQAAIDKNNYEPLKALGKLLMKADCFATGNLLAGSCYLDFLNAFPTATILTFNHDCLPEIIAYQLGQWRPEDGFGVAVRAELNPLYSGFVLPRESIRKILHLHGSLYVYGVETAINPGGSGAVDVLQHLEVAQFVFDPYSVSHKFPSHRRPAAGLIYQHPYERFIAPVPSKADGLKREFIHQVHDRARYLLSKGSDIVVAVGYSFNPNDSASYEPLLKALNASKVLVVVPEAVGLVRRLRSDYSSINWVPMACGFGKWAEAGFPGAQN